MESIKSWAVCVVFSVAAASVINLIAPDSGGEKAVKFVTAVFVLVSFFSVFTSLDVDVTEYTDSISEALGEHELNKQAKEQTKGILTEHIRASIASKLTAMGYENYEIEIEIYIDSDENISLESIDVAIENLFERDVCVITEYIVENFGDIEKVSVKGESK